jgi:hypothetical protein
MVLLPAAVFAVAGPEPGAYAAGLLVAAVASAAVYVVLFRRALPGTGWWAAPAAAAAVLLTRVPLTEFDNRRFTVLAYPAVALLFWPRPAAGGPAPWWQWALAGALPLLHPALLVASVVWIVAEGLRAVRTRALSAPGLAAAAAGVAACAAWYLDPDTVSTQFLPHLRSRPFSPFGGWKQPVSPVFAIPSQVTLAAVPALAALGALARPWRTYEAVFRVYALLAVGLGLDALGYMGYLPYLLVGLAPAVVRLAADGRTTPWLARAAVAAAAVNLVVDVKLGAGMPRRPVTAAEARDFLRAHTRPGDVIVVGPPFVLTAADPAGLGDREVRHVVPVALYLADFDERRFLAGVRRDATVYVGHPAYFDGVMRDFKPTSAPVFENARRTVVPFRGDDVLVARPGGD